jgi:hypothetical protein
MAIWTTLLPVIALLVAAPRGAMAVPNMPACSMLCNSVMYRPDNPLKASLAYVMSELQSTTSVWLGWCRWLPH